MFRSTKSPTKKTGAPNVARVATMQFGVGVVKGNPKKCLCCKKRIRKGEAWTKHWSPVDPELGRYAIIIHDRCNGARG